MTRNKALSKSKLMAFRQCPRRLWLEVHQPKLRRDSAAAKERFEIGYQVGDIARQLYDPKKKGQLIEPKIQGYDAALSRNTPQLIDL